MSETGRRRSRPSRKVKAVNLDPHLCQQARRARDARFDGRFFVAVRTTRIYCRPVCPAPAAKEANVVYYPTAFAAEAAGFRPCLRCRPETAPGAGLWLGTAPTVVRGLRLIDEGALDAGSVEQLAARLGVTGRHLRRLFLEHAGATPVRIAQTRRLQFAKRLLDETSLPLTEVAHASGFGSLGRLHAVVQATYGRSPGQLRLLHAPSSALRLTVHEPYDWSSLLAFLRARAIPGLEEVDDERYTRHWEDATITVRYAAPHLLLTVAGAAPRQWPDIVRRTRRLFDAAADPTLINETLAADPLLAPLVAARPGLRVPGAWDAFEIGVRAILGQQISVAGARTLAGRLLASFRKMPSPEQLADADLSSIGLPAARQQTLRAYARAVLDGNERLEGIPGIGPWTRAYYAMRALADPDAFPAGDLVLRKAAHCTEKELTQRAEAWRPWRAYAAVHLWRSQA